MEKVRNITQHLARRLGEPRPLIQVLIGPRQVGKTTALMSTLAGRGVYETADYPTPLPAAVINDLWDRALASPDRILAIDEVQKIPGWSEVVKRRWDLHPHALKVVLTGSSALLLEKGLRETLAGRFELLRASHWSFAEAHAVFGLDLFCYVEFGCYPGSVPLLPDVGRWAAYVRDAIVEPAIGRDLLSLHPVENPALLRQVFGVAVALPAQLISLQKMQGQLQERGSLPTLNHYLHLLSQAFLVSPVEKYSATALRSKKSVPKLIVHDNALVRAFERPVSAPLSPVRLGAYFENAVGARLLEAGWETYYWKDRDLEVDFVALGPAGERWAIEVKSAPARSADLAGLDAFIRRHPGFEPCLVSAVGQEIPGMRSIGGAALLSLERSL